MAVTSNIKGVKDLTDDDVAGRQELTLSLKREALAQAGVNAAYVARLLACTVKEKSSRVFAMPAKR
jgi:Cu/Ag efflux pump CusA